MHISTKNSYSWETGLWLETYLRLTLVHKPRGLDTLLAPQKTGDFTWQDAQQGEIVKACQCPQFVRALLNLSNRNIVEDTPNTF